MQLQPRGSALPMLLVLTCSFVLNILGITWGLPNYADWAQDSMALETLEAIAKRFAHGWFDKYPPVHHAILAVCYTPYLGYLLLARELQASSKIFPYGLTDPLSALTHFILIARGVSVLMGTAIVWLVYVVVCELFDRRAALFAALIVTLCYPLVYYAHNANADVLYLFWAFLAIYHFLRFLKNGRLQHYVLFALFGMLSICSKDPAYGLFLLSPLPILWIRFTEISHTALRQRIASVLFDRRLLIAATVTVGTFILAHNILFNPAGLLGHVKVLGKVWPNVSYYAPTLEGRLQLLWATGGEIAHGLTLPLFVLCVAGAVYGAYRFSRYSLPLLFLAVSYYFTHINVIRFLTLRYVLPMCIILAFFGGKLLSEGWYRGSWKTLQRGVICLVFAYAALFPIQLDFLLIGGESRYGAERWMQAHFKKGAIVETFASSHLHLHWYYPHFPSWTKVRNSQLAMGTQWIPHAIRPEQVRFPNFYSGREAPDYIVLTFLRGQEARMNQERLLTDLFRGHLGYTLVATFKVPTIVPILLNINPRIDIFERTEDYSTTSPFPKQ